MIRQTVHKDSDESTRVKVVSLDGYRGPHPGLGLLSKRLVKQGSSHPIHIVMIPPVGGGPTGDTNWLPVTYLAGKEPEPGQSDSGFI